MLLAFYRFMCFDCHDIKHPCQVLTDTRFSSTKGVSMWCRMVAMMSLKSMAEMTPLLPMSFWANAWRACSSCSSCKAPNRWHRVRCG